MDLEPFLRPELTLDLDRCESREELFEKLAETTREVARNLSPEAIAQSLLERERQAPTSTPEGVAYPHAVVPDMEEPIVIVARVRGGVDFGVEGHPPCDLVFCLLGGAPDPWEHVRLLARLARLVHTPEARDHLRAAADANELRERLLQEDRSHA